MAIVKITKKQTKKKDFSVRNIDFQFVIDIYSKM